MTPRASIPGGQASRGAVIAIATTTKSQQSSPRVISALKSQECTNVMSAVGLGSPRLLRILRKPLVKLNPDAAKGLGERGLGRTCLPQLHSCRPAGASAGPRPHRKPPRGQLRLEPQHQHVRDRRGPRRELPWSRLGNWGPARDNGCSRSHSNLKSGAPGQVR